MLVSPIPQWFRLKTDTKIQVRRPSSRANNSSLTTHSVPCSTTPSGVTGGVLSSTSKPPPHALYRHPLVVLERDRDRAWSTTAHPLASCTRPYVYRTRSVYGSPLNLIILHDLVLGGYRIHSQPGDWHSQLPKRVRGLIEVRVYFISCQGDQYNEHPRRLRIFKHAMLHSLVMFGRMPLVVRAPLYDSELSLLRSQLAPLSSYIVASRRRKRIHRPVSGTPSREIRAV